MVLTEGQTDMLQETSRPMLEELVFVEGVLNKTDPLYKEFLTKIKMLASVPDEEHAHLTNDFRMLLIKEKLHVVFLQPLTQNMSSK